MGASLAEIIRARRVVRGMERQDLAAAVGCDVRTVRRWESGCRPLTRHMPALRKALDIPLDEMDRIMLALLRDSDGRMRIEGPEFLQTRGLSHEWLAEALLAMDRRLIDDHPTLGVHDPEQWAPVFEALPDSWRLLTHRGEIVGNWHFVPLAPGVHEAMRAGRMRESEIRLDHLASLDLPGAFDINVTALVLEPAYRQGSGLVMLLRSLCDRLCKLAGRGIHVGRVGAIAWTPASVLLCRRLGMTPVRNMGNDHGLFFEAGIDALQDPLGLTEFTRLRKLHRPECCEAMQARGDAHGDGEARSGGRPEARKPTQGECRE